MIVQPLAIDLFCGLGGWTEGLLSEGYRVVGFDCERHVYGAARYPAQLVLQDVLTLDGAQFKDAALIVASPPCQAYSYRAMPWKRARALPPPDNTLFEACFRIQREAIAAAGRFIPLVVENVCGAQPWVGRARWHHGSFYLWGDVPALMPITQRHAKQNRNVVHPVHGHNVILPQVVNRELLDTQSGPHGIPWSPDGAVRALAGNTHEHNTTSGLGQNHDGRKTAKNGGPDYGGSFGWDGPPMRQGNSKSSARKAASAHIAKIPTALSRHIARMWYPDQTAPDIVACNE